MYFFFLITFVKKKPKYKLRLKKNNKSVINNNLLYIFQTYSKYIISRYKLLLIR